jgi:hypothetical protein
LVLKLTLHQIEAVLSLSGPKRYEHFVKVVADQRKLWGLFQEGWAIAATEAGTPVFPVWPAEPYAHLCAQGEWRGYDPREIDLDEFFEELMPRLRSDGVQLGVFYTPSDRGVLPSLEEIESDLRVELSRIE